MLARYLRASLKTLLPHSDTDTDHTSTMQAIPMQTSFNGQRLSVSARCAHPSRPPCAQGCCRTFWSRQLLDRGLWCTGPGLRGQLATAASVWPGSAHQRGEPG